MEPSRAKHLKIGQVYLYEYRKSFRLITGFTNDNKSVYYVTEINYYGLCSREHFVRKCPWICPDNLVKPIWEDGQRFLESLNK